MMILLNGKKEEIESGITISKLLEVKKIRPEVVTVELNDEIIKRPSYKDVFLKDKDRLEFVYYMGGGSTHRKIVPSTGCQKNKNQEEYYAFFR